MTLFSIFPSVHFLLGHVVTPDCTKTQAESKTINPGGQSVSEIDYCYKTFQLANYKHYPKAHHI